MAAYLIGQIIIHDKIGSAFLVQRALPVFTRFGTQLEALSRNELDV